MYQILVVKGFSFKFYVYLRTNRTQSSSKVRLSLTCNSLKTSLHSGESYVTERNISIEILHEHFIFQIRESNSQSSVERNPGVRWFYFTLLYNQSRNLALLSQTTAFLCTNGKENSFMTLRTTGMSLHFSAAPLGIFSAF